MRAALCKKLGPPRGLTVVDGLPSLKAGLGQIVIAVKACGVNFPDVLSVMCYSSSLVIC
jgi:NADPH:quinone reductase